ncbi:MULTISPECIES: hypothetical protein [Paracidovorax]|uniref:hypothetical protein n=1 Tax=Paracidovorax TaxID=3051137 RepID=UPI0012EC7A69|nr:MULTISPECIES: hypothetical protein [Paracidovorax]
MSEKASKQQTERGLDVKTAEQNIKNNQNDEVEGTFCYELFELNTFNEELLRKLIFDMKFLAAGPRDKIQSKPIKWIILNTMRCITSHFNKNDLYKIKNLNEEIYSKWSDEYFEEFKEILLNLDR